jgi:hypothetical protein
VAPTVPVLPLVEPDAGSSETALPQPTRARAASAAVTIAIRFMDNLESFREKG